VPAARRPPATLRLRASRRAAPPAHARAARRTAAGTLRQKALEHVLDPPRRLAAAAARQGLKPQEFDVMRHGETRVFPPPPR